MKTKLFTILICLCFIAGNSMAWDDGSSWDEYRQSLRNLKYDIIPAVDDARDLGTASKQFKDVYIDGVLYSDDISQSGDYTTTGNIEGATITEGGIAVPNTGDKLSVFSATSSAELAGVISDETGSGALVFGTAPTIAGGNISGVFTTTSFSIVGDISQTGDYTTSGSIQGADLTATDLLS